MGRIRISTAAAVLGGMLIGVLTITPSARATITASSITTPTDLSYFIADHDASSQTFTISGTTSGGNPAVDKLDIRCYYGTTSILVAGNVALDSSGAFSIATAGLAAIQARVCRLRAVPAGTTPSSVTPFAGPRIGVGERYSYKLTSGPNTGRLHNYYIYAQQLTGAFDFVALGDGDSFGPLYDGYLFDPTFANTTVTFYGNGGLLSAESGTPTRSEIRIDGVNAYDPGGATHINSDASGLPVLTYSYSLDPATGNLVIHETDPLVKCPDATYPPTTTSCATFVSAGVKDVRTMTQDHDGHIGWVTDVFTSTDGHAHSLDLLWNNAMRFRSNTAGDSSKLAYEFPGQSAFAMHAVGDVVSLPGSPGTILVKMSGAADGNTATGQGAIVYDRPLSAAAFTYVGQGESQFTLHQTGTIPANGSTRFRFAYAQAFKAADLATLAQTATTAFLNPLTVAKQGKGAGRVTSVPAGISCGTECSHGYPYGTSVTLTAKPSKTSAFAGWSGACSGAGTCTLDLIGNLAATATFDRICVVPKVKGRKAKRAKYAIRHAYCSVGKVKHAFSAKVKKGRVISQRPKPGTRLKAHAKVDLKVSKGRRR